MRLKKILQSIADKIPLKRKNKLIHGQHHSRILTVLGLCAVGIVVVFIVSSCIGLFGLKYSIFELFSEINFWLANGSIDLFLIFGLLSLYRVDAQNEAQRAADMENSAWLTKKEMEKAHEFTLTTWTNITSVPDGIILRAVKTRKTIDAEYEIADPAAETAGPGDDQPQGEILKPDADALADPTGDPADTTASEQTQEESRKEDQLSKDVANRSIHEKAKDMDILLCSQLHTVVVGTTGVGKTRGFLDQNIEILAHTKTKPSMVLTDPKGELFIDHAKNLEKAGYTVHVIDLEYPFSSTKYNPFQILIRRVQILRAHKLFVQSLPQYRDESAKSQKSNLQKHPINADYITNPVNKFRDTALSGSYYVAVGAFSDLKQAEAERARGENDIIQDFPPEKIPEDSDEKPVRYFVLKKFNTYTSGQEFLATTDSELFEYAQDLVFTLCPVTDKNQPMWQESARNLILGFVVAMYEDAIAGRIPVSTLTPFNMFQNITKYATNSCEELKAYLVSERRKLNPFSTAPSLSQPVLLTEDRQLASFLSEVGLYMQQFVDKGIQAMTVENEIDLTTFDDKPTALFIIIPAVKTGRYPFATLLVTQLYKELNYKANLRQRQSSGLQAAELKRRVYFLLEEFGMLPKFNDLDKWVNIGRSMGIRFVFVMQAFTQMRHVYGDDVTNTILGGCNIKIYLGTSDDKTRKEFSELCGYRKMGQIGINTSADLNSSSNASVQEKPLISASELMRLNGEEKGKAIIIVTGFNPIWAEFTFSFDKDVKHLLFPRLPATRGGEGKFNNFSEEKQAEAFTDIQDVLGTMQDEMNIISKNRREEQAEEQRQRDELAKRKKAIQNGRMKNSAASDKELKAMQDEIVTIQQWIFQTLENTFSAYERALQEIEEKKAYMVERNFPYFEENVAAWIESLVKRYPVQDIEIFYEGSGFVNAFNNACDLIKKYVGEKKKRADVKNSVDV